MPVLNWTVFSGDCKVLLEGRVNRGWTNAQDLRLCFRIEPAQTFFLVAPPPALRLMFAIPNNRCQKS